VTKSAARPSKNVTLTFDEWKGYSSGSAVNNALKFVDSLTFSKEKDGPEKKPEPGKKASLSDIIRTLALKGQ
jgi:hypothetical protein